MTSLKIGWIGTGVMGHSMCDHLIKAGHHVSVYNRTKKRADALVAQGAQWCDSPAELARDADFIFSIVGFPADVEEVLLGENGALATAKPGSIIIDMTTSSPQLARTIADAAREKDVLALDAPVSGGDLGARNGSLAIMVGGDKSAYDKTLPLFEIMGANINHMGDVGTGQHTKMSNQILIAGTMVGVVESLLYAQRMGMSPEKVIDVIGSGAAGSWSINNLGPRICKGDYDPGFYIKHFVKDMGVALEEAKRMNLSLPGLALVNQLYIAAQAMGFEDLGTQGLYKVLAKMNNMDV